MPPYLEHPARRLQAGVTLQAVDASCTAETETNGTLENFLIRSRVMNRDRQSRRHCSARRGFATAAATGRKVNRSRRNRRPPSHLSGAAPVTSANHPLHPCDRHADGRRAGLGGCGDSGASSRRHRAGQRVLGTELVRLFYRTDAQVPRSRRQRRPDRARLGIGPETPSTSTRYWCRTPEVSTWPKRVRPHPSLLDQRVVSQSGSAAADAARTMRQQCESRQEPRGA